MTAAAAATTAPKGEAISHMPCLEILRSMTAIANVTYVQKEKVEAIICYKFAKFLAKKSMIYGTKIADVVTGDSTTKHLSNQMELGNELLWSDFP